MSLGGRGNDDTRHRGSEGSRDRRDHSRLGGEGVRRPLSRRRRLAHDRQRPQVVEIAH